ANIRNSIASRVVYQSHFVQGWWRRIYGSGPEGSVIYNGVDLQLFNPAGDEKPTQTNLRMVMVEGSLLGGYELGLESAIALAERVQIVSNRKVELVIAGRVDDAQKAKWSSRSTVDVNWVGVLANEQIPALNRSAHLLYSSDINAACPNSVIEAMACGLPVLAFDTGALKELITPSAGRVVPYGGDPWKLDPPDIAGLAKAATDILNEQSRFRAGARTRAEEAFGLDKMADAYIEALIG
ncbi:MAG: glycosyltransferase family 4 protein, partial [Anaerolineales bacterium]